MVKNQKGFSLVELLAVIAIISILFILLIPQISNTFEKARLTGLKTDLHSYQIAANSFLMYNGWRDITEESFNQHLDKALQFTSSKSKKLNPWKKPYVLKIATDKKSFTITTQNKDKEPKEYSLVVTKNEEGEIQMDVSGLDGSKKGDSNTSTEESLTEEEKTLCESRTITETDASYFTVVDKDGGVSITAYSNDGPKDVVIPCQIGGGNVVDIGGVGSKGAFENKSITSVVLPNSLKTISGSFAFSENQLTNVTIPNSVTIIGNDVFNTNQLTSVTIPDGVTSIGNDAFYQNQLTSVVIGSSVSSIGNDAFNNNQLTSVVIGSSVSSIGIGAFYKNQLTSVTIPNSVTSIGLSAFYSNQDLKTVINKSSISNTVLAQYFNSSPTITN